jgi:hypothetical protein
VKIPVVPETQKSKSPKNQKSQDPKTKSQDSKNQNPKITSYPFFAAGNSVDIQGCSDISIEAVFGHITIVWNRDGICSMTSKS